MSYLVYIFLFGGGSGGQKTLSPLYPLKGSLSHPQETVTQSFIPCGHDIMGRMTINCPHCDHEIELAVVNSQFNSPTAQEYADQYTGGDVNELWLRVGEADGSLPQDVVNCLSNLTV